MKKRGQITLFIIIGIIILIIAFFLFLMRDQIIVESIDSEPTETISFEKYPFDEYVMSCIERKAYPAIKLMSELGGTLDIDDYTFYKGLPYRSFLKYDECDQDIISKENMQQELNAYLEYNMLSCLDFNDFKKQKFNIEFENGFPEPKVSTIIASDEVIVKLNLKFKASKQGYSIDFNEFRETIKLPLGRLYDLALTISDQEAKDHHFDKDSWMLDHGEEIQIEKHKPYPNIVYSLSKHADNYGFTMFFNFGIKGKNIASNPGEAPPKTLAGEYFYKCYPDVPITEFSNEECEDGECQDCIIDKGTVPHGSRWCDYDGTTQPGKALVGSRHFLLSCHNGHFYVEECADYREELCTDDGLAVCRPNQWQNCVNAGSKGACASAGDCYWYDYLDVDFEAPKRAPLNPPADICSTPSSSTDRSKCIPFVPPGLKFWESSSSNYCNMANHLTAFFQPTFREEIFAINVPYDWVEYAGANCFYVGDCGNYNNIAGQLSRGGYWNVVLATEQRNEFLDYSKLIIPPQKITLESNVSTYQSASYSPKVDQSNINSYLNSYYTLATQWANDPCERDMCGTQPFICDGFCCILNACAIDAPKHTSIDCSDGDVYLRNIYKDFVKWVPGASVCNAWSAPSSSNCNLCKADPLRPCSEYRCKSLGTSCSYYEIYGEPDCADLNNPNDPYYKIIKDSEYYLAITYPSYDTYSSSTYYDNLEIVFDDSFLPAGYTSSSLNFFAYGRVIDGYEINPGVNVASNLNIRFDTNKPAKCKIQYIPTNEYSDYLDYLVSMGRESTTINNHNFEYFVESLSLTLENFKDALDLIDVIELPNEIGLEDSLRIILNQLILAMKSEKLYIFVDCIDSMGNRDETFFLYSLDAKSNKPPVVKLNSPEDNSVETKLNVTFNFTVSEDASASINCKLYTGIDDGSNIKNWSMKKERIFGFPSSMSEWHFLFDIEFNEFNKYAWNVECNDGVSTRFAPVNRSFIIT